MPTSSTHADQFTDNQIRAGAIEWPTLALFGLVYVSWMLLTLFHAQLHALLLIVALSFLVALHSSLQHEVIHGHPTRWNIINKALAFPALGLVVPFERYELLHIQHHRNWLITDPFEDSESYFMASKQWRRCNAAIQAVLCFNNTLVGRLTIGPAIMFIRMVISEYRVAKTNRYVHMSWVWHFVGVAMVMLWLWFVGYSIVLYLFGVAYPAMSILMLRAYGEHLPEENIEYRSAIIKTNRFMQLLYLNNNLHRVHHDHPEAPWYQLPKLYRQHYEQHTVHIYAGYLSLFRQFALKQRFPVEHPFLAKD